MIKTKYIKENDTYAIAPWYLSYFVDLDSKDYDYPILGRLEPFSLEVFYNRLDFVFEFYTFDGKQSQFFTQKATSCKEYSVNLKNNLISLEFSINNNFLDFLRAFKYNRKTTIKIKGLKNSISENYPKDNFLENFEDFEVILKDETAIIVNIYIK